MHYGWIVLLSVWSLALSSLSDSLHLHPGFCQDCPDFGLKQSNSPVYLISDLYLVVYENFNFKIFIEIKFLVQCTRKHDTDFIKSPIYSDNYVLQILTHQKIWDLLRPCQKSKVTSY